MARRPYDIGDRILVVGPENAMNYGVSYSWFVEGTLKCLVQFSDTIFNCAHHALAICDRYQLVQHNITLRRNQRSCDCEQFVYCIITNHQLQPFIQCPRDPRFAVFGHHDRRAVSHLSRCSRKICSGPTAHLGFCPLLSSRRYQLKPKFDGVYIAMSTYKVLARRCLNLDESIGTSLLLL